jgi:hypothetical protein
MGTELETPANSDSTEAFEAKETANRLPVGWLVLFFGLILWGLYYAYAYTPALGGWSQAAELEQGASPGSTVATIGFTVAAAIGVVVIAAYAGAKRR